MQALRKIGLLLSYFLILSLSLRAEASKKVLILYSTGGHATAARSIEAMLNEHPEEFEVVRKDYAEELNGYAHWFYLHGYDLISKKANWINKLGTAYAWWKAEKNPEFASTRDDADFNQPERILEYIKSVGPDVIITTHFSLAQTLAVLRERGELKSIPIAWTHLDIVDNTFFQQIGDQLDMSFLPTDQMRASWAKTIPNSKLIASGIPIMSAVPLEKREIKQNSSNILLLGGSMGALSYNKIISDLAARFPSDEMVDVTAVCGRNEQMREWLNRWKTRRLFPRNIRLQVEGFVDQGTMRELQIKSDLIISKPGGLTSFELLNSGKPVILTEAIGIQEQKNAAFIADEGAALYLPKIQGIGKVIVSLLRDSQTEQNALLANQERLRENFKLDEIVQWTRTATVVQPDRPALPLLTKKLMVQSCKDAFYD